MKKLQNLRDNGPVPLRNKPAFAVTVVKDGATTYRAMFAGFKERAARELCEEIVRKALRCQVVAPGS